MQELLSQHETHEQATPSNLEGDELILAHRLWVKYIARKISTKVPSHVEWNELLCAGIPGRLDAIEKFAPNRGIKGATLDGLCNLVWGPRSPCKKSKVWERVYTEKEQRLGRAATDKELCEAMDIPLEEFYELVDKIKGLNLGSFQERSCQDDGKNSEPLVKCLPDASRMDPFFAFHKPEIQDIPSIVSDSTPTDRVPCCVPVLFRRAYHEGNWKNPLRQGVTRSVVPNQGNATASN